MLLTHVRGLDTVVEESHQTPSPCIFVMTVVSLHNGAMAGSVTVSKVSGVLEGKKAAAREQTPVVVFAVGDKRVQTKALKVGIDAGC